MLSFEAKLIQRLREELEKTSDAALTSPRSDSLFEYGRVVGVYQGLKSALQVVDDLMTEQDEENQRDGRILSLHR